MNRFFRRTTTIYGALLIVGISAGFLIRDYTASSTIPLRTIREPGGKYKFIDPLIGFIAGEKTDFPEYDSLEHVLKDDIALLKKENKVSSASVYFRDMQSGHWTGVNEEELYAPASLYKVALMIAVLKRSENEKTNVLDRKLMFTDSIEPEEQDFVSMEKGRTYSVRELLERLIILSDNDAKNMLRSLVGNEAVSAVFTDLRLSEPALSEIGDTMSARTYSRFFRTLYNSTYLNRSNSEYALDLLSKVEFKSGIVNGLPKEARELPVAHKFGYRIIEDPIDTVTTELHDCGIVYLPGKPYFVCIMTKGWEQHDLLDAIQILSQDAYSEAAR